MNKFAQLGYEFSGAGFTRESVVRSLLETTSNKFATEISADLKKDLLSGIFLRYAEKRTDLNQGYIQQGENFIAVDDKAFKAHRGAKYQMTVANLLSIDKSEISKMAQLDKPRHNLVAKPRTKAINYGNDTLKDMQSLAKRILNGDTGGNGRAGNLNWQETVMKTLFDTKNGLMKKAITAKAGSDNTFNEQQWNESMKAFKTVWQDKKWSVDKADIAKTAKA